jgi:hypothetical protein
MIAKIHSPLFGNAILRDHEGAGRNRAASLIQPTLVGLTPATDQIPS